jgi:hypothetical protein
LIIETVFIAPSGTWSAIIILAPCLASSSEVARPIPEPPPVTKIALPSRDPAIFPSPFFALSFFSFQEPPQPPCTEPGE